MSQIASKSKIMDSLQRTLHEEWATTPFNDPRFLAEMVIRVLCVGESRSEFTTLPNLTLAIKRDSKLQKRWEELFSVPIETLKEKLGKRLASGKRISNHFANIGDMAHSLHTLCEMYSALGDTTVLDIKKESLGFAIGFRYARLTHHINIQMISGIASTTGSARGAKSRRYTPTQKRELARNAKRLFNESGAVRVPDKVRHVARHAITEPGETVTGVSLDTARERLRWADMIPPAKPRRKRRRK